MAYVHQHLAGANGGRPKISLEPRLGCDKYLRRRVRSDVAIPRMRAPEEGRSRRLRSREAPIRENGGTFLPTTRPDDLSQHDRRHRLATSPLGQGAPSNRTPASSRPTPRPQRTSRPATAPTPAGLPGRTDGGRPRRRTPCAPEGRSFRERPGLPSRPPKPPAPKCGSYSDRRRTARPGKGRDHPRTRDTDAIPAGQGSDRGAARRSRVLVE